jgi:hypothetical protein
MHRDGALFSVISAAKETVVSFGAPVARFQYKGVGDAETAVISDEGVESTEKWHSFIAAQLAETITSVHQVISSRCFLCGFLVSRKFIAALVLLERQCNSQNKSRYHGELV